MNAEERNDEVASASEQTFSRPTSASLFSFTVPTTSAQNASQLPASAGANQTTPFSLFQSTPSLFSALNNPALSGSANLFGSAGTAAAASGTVQDEEQPAFLPKSNLFGQRTHEEAAAASSLFTSATQSAQARSQADEQPVFVQPVQLESPGAILATPSKMQQRLRECRAALIDMKARDVISEAFMPITSGEEDTRAALDEHDALEYNFLTILSNVTERVVKPLESHAATLIFDVEDCQGQALPTYLSRMHKHMADLTSRHGLSLANIRSRSQEIRETVASVERRQLELKDALNSLLAGEIRSKVLGSTYDFAIQTLLVNEDREPLFLRDSKDMLVANPMAFVNALLPMEKRDLAALASKVCSTDSCLNNDLYQRRVNAWFNVLHQASRTQRVIDEAAGTALR